jgi:hypothetical protein
LSRSEFNDDILAFNVAKVTHTLTEFLNISGECACLIEKAYLSHFCRLLRLDWIKRSENQPKHY